MTPARIVSLVPSTTETLFALGPGVAARVVGVTDYCVRPEGIPASVARVGGTKTPDVAAIRALAPDLVLANQEENRSEDVVDLARDHRVAVFYPRCPADAIRDLRRLGELVGEPEPAERLAARAEAGLRSLRAAARPFTYLYLIWRRPWMAAGPGTYIDAFLAEGGGRNVVAEVAEIAEAGERYPRLSPDWRELPAEAPDLVLLSDEPYPFEERHAEEIGRLKGPRWRASCRWVPGDAFSWHGVRMIEGMANLERLVVGG